MGLSFHGTGRQALHEVSLIEQEEEAGRDQCQHARCHHLPENRPRISTRGEQPDRESGACIRRSTSAQTEARSRLR